MSFARRVQSVINSYQYLQQDACFKIFGSRCNCHFKVDEIHLKFQVNGHLKSKKYQTKSEIHTSQPLISSSMFTANTQFTSNKNYSLLYWSWYLASSIFWKEHNGELPSTQTLYNHVDLIYHESLEKEKEVIGQQNIFVMLDETYDCLLYTSPSPRD